MALVSRAGFKRIFKGAAVVAVLVVSLKYAAFDELGSLWSQEVALTPSEEETSFVSSQGGAPSFAVAKESFTADRAASKKSAVLTRAKGGRSTPETPSMVVCTADLALLAKSPVQEMTRIAKAVRELGGLVLNSVVEKRNSSTDSVRMVLRVPVARLDDLRGVVKQGMERVDRDSVEARDVTKEYIDMSARLTNLQAEEQQYRQILKQAHTVEDTLQVTDKLGEVRGEIEALQGTLNFLENQAEMSTLQVSIVAEADAVVAGVRWRPLYQAKMAMRGGLDGLADYVNTMFVLIFRIPAVLSWLVTLVIFTVVGWRITLWIWRRLRPLVQPVQAGKPA